MGFFIDSLIGLVLVGMLVGVLLIHRKQRLLIDSLIALLLVGVLASILMYHRNQQRLNEQYERVQSTLALLRDQVAYHGALKVDSETSGAFPVAISPLWFKTGLPMNTLVPGWHPWLDVAPEGDLERDPPDPIVTHPRQASMWYNPNLGVIKARVKDQGTDSATVELYNLINGTDLPVLAKSDNRQRQPLPLMSVLVAQFQAEKRAKAQRDAVLGRDELEGVSVDIHPPAAPAGTTRAGFFR